MSFQSCLTERTYCSLAEALVTCMFCSNVQSVILYNCKSYLSHGYWIFGAIISSMFQFNLFSTEPSAQVWKLNLKSLSLSIFICNAIPVWLLKDQNQSRVNLLIKLLELQSSILNLHVAMILLQSMMGNKQGHTKVEKVSTIPNQLNFTKPPPLWRFCELSSEVRPTQLS